MGGWGGERLRCGTGKVFKVSAVKREVTFWCRREGVGFIPHEVSMCWAGQFPPVSVLWRHLCSPCSASYTILFLGLMLAPCSLCSVSLVCTFVGIRWVLTASPCCHSARCALLAEQSKPEVWIRLVFCIAVVCGRSPLQR